MTPRWPGAQDPLREWEQGQWTFCDFQRCAGPWVAAGDLGFVPSTRVGQSLRAEWSTDAEPPILGLKTQAYPETSNAETEEKKRVSCEDRGQGGGQRRRVWPGPLGTVISEVTIP